MPKKKEETTVKDTAKATTKTTKETTAKKTAAKTKPAAKTKTAAKAKSDTKITNITKIAAEEKIATEEKQAAEKNLALSCQEMMSSIIEWTMDSLMYSNILLISKKLKISMEEAAGILDVSAIDLAKISLVYAAYSKTPEAEKAAVLGKYSDRI